uniref:Uncharacterized protein n=1 Tax=Cannabis sativa TaxID=3483 RepID=A0A803P1L4_CANSA
MAYTLEAKARYDPSTWDPSVSIERPNSSLESSDVQSYLSLYALGEGVKVVPAKKGQNVGSALDDSCAWTKYIEVGATLPLHDYFRDVENYFDISPVQIAPHGSGQPYVSGICNTNGGDKHRSSYFFTTPMDTTHRAFNHMGTYSRPVPTKEMIQHAIASTVMPAAEKHASTIATAETLKLVGLYPPEHNSTAISTIDGPDAPVVPFDRGNHSHGNFTIAYSRLFYPHVFATHYFEEGYWSDCWC